jgi:hypothetical protein
VTAGGDLGRGIDGPRLFDLADAGSEAAPRGDPRPLRPLQAELIAAAGAILLLVSLLFLKWFGLGGPVGPFAPRAVTTGSEGAWHTLTLLRWPALLASAVALLPVLVRPAQRWLGLPRRTHLAVAALGSLTALLLGYRVLIDLPDPSRVVDQKAGAVLGLAGALLIAIGGLESMRADPRQVRARRARSARRRQRVPPGQIVRAHA